MFCSPGSPGNLTISSLEILHRESLLSTDIKTTFNIYKRAAESGILFKLDIAV